MDMNKPPDTVSTKMTASACSGSRRSLLARLAHSPPPPPCPTLSPGRVQPAVHAIRVDGAAPQLPAPRLPRQQRSWAAVPAQAQVGLGVRAAPPATHARPTRPLPSPASAVVSKRSWRRKRLKRSHRMVRRPLPSAEIADGGPAHVKGLSMGTGIGCTGVVRETASDVSWPAPGRPGMGCLAIQVSAQAVAVANAS